MSNKERIMRDLEYVCGGIAAMSGICLDEKSKHWKRLFDEWNENLCEVIDLIEEDYNECQKPWKNLQ